MVGQAIADKEIPRATDLSPLDVTEYFDDHQNMEITATQPQSLEDIAAAFAALGQPSRLKIVRLLLSAYPQGLPAGEIQKDLAISAPTLSHHLDKLRRVGLVTATKDRQWICYRVQSASLRFLIDFLFEECCTRNQVVEVDDLELPDSAADPEPAENS
jgi:ArsR family transcriptional regulator